MQIDLTEHLVTQLAHLDNGGPTVPARVEAVRHFLQTFHLLLKNLQQQQANVHTCNILISLQS